MGETITLTDGAEVDDGRPWWIEHANCVGKTGLFFPPRGERPEARERREAAARIVCCECPVLDDCQEHARGRRELGFWGGESELERAEAGFAPSTPVIGIRSQQRTRQTA